LAAKVAHAKLVEAVAEKDEELMHQFLEGKAISGRAIAGRHFAVLY